MIEELRSPVAFSAAPAIRILVTNAHGDLILELPVGLCFLTRQKSIPTAYTSKKYTSLSDVLLSLPVRIVLVVDMS